MTDQLRRPRRGWPSGSSACASSSSAARWPSTRPASAASRRCSSRAREEGPGGHRRAAPARTSSCTSRRRTRCAPARTPPSRSPTPHRTTSSAVRRAAWPSRPTRCASRSLGAAERRRRGAPSPSSARRRRARATSPWPSAPRTLAGVEIVARRRHAGVPRHGHRHGQADGGRAGRGRATTASTWSTRPTSSPSAEFQARRRALAASTSPGAGTAPCSSAAPGCTSAPSTDLELPGHVAGVRAELEAEADDERGRPCIDELRRARPGRPPRRWSRRTRRRIVRALEVCLGSGRPFRSFGPGLDAYPPIAVVQLGLRWPRPVLAERIDGRVHRMIEPGLLDEVRGSGASRTGAVAHGAPGAGLQGAASTTSRAAAASTRRSTRSIVRTRQFAVRQERWFRRDPRIRWVDIDADPVAEAVPRARGLAAAMNARTHQAPRSRQRLPGRCCRPRSNVARPGRRWPSQLVRPPPRHRRRRLAHRSTCRAGSRDRRGWCCSTPTAAAPR